MTQGSPAVAHPGASTDVLAIVARVKTLLQSLPAAAPFLETWPGPSPLRPTVAQGCPVLNWLDETATRSTPATAPLVDAIVAGAGSLAWGQTYTAADFGAAFLERYGWTEFIGTKGPVPSTTIACGVLMLGPWIEYPAHAHEAEELYLPLSGTAAWTRGQEEAVRRPPGQPIHHPAWIRHAMRTEAEPLLALYVWRGGNLAAKSTIL
jgi:mannose-6-phosphate isomerase-like protein (cupin superfamily)